MTDQPEQWKPIPGFGSYDASTEGNIRSRRRKWTKHQDGRVMVPHPNHASYLQVIVRSDEGVTYCRRVHRLVLETWVDRPPTEECQGSHIDGDPTNNVVFNLVWETPRANRARSAHIGRRRGNFHGRCNSKLSEEKVRAMRALEAPDVRALATEHGVGVQAIKDALAGTTWTWIDEEAA